MSSSVNFLYYKFIFFLLVYRNNYNKSFVTIMLQEKLNLEIVNRQESSIQDKALKNNAKIATKGFENKVRKETSRDK